MKGRYIDDFNSWQNDQSYANRDVPAPDPNDYDANGYKFGIVEYIGNRVIDPYLIKTYGYKYAYDNPIEILNEDKRNK